MTPWCDDPPPPPYGGGSKLLCVLWPLCVYLDLGPEELFSSIWTPLTHGGGPGSQLQLPQVPPPPYGPLAVRTSRCVFPPIWVLGGGGSQGGWGTTCSCSFPAPVVPLPSSRCLVRLHQHSFHPAHTNPMETGPENIFWAQNRGGEPKDGGGVRHFFTPPPKK